MAMESWVAVIPMYREGGAPELHVCLRFKGTHQGGGGAPDEIAQILLSREEFHALEGRIAEAAAHLRDTDRDNAQNLRPAPVSR